MLKRTLNVVLFLAVLINHVFAQKSPASIFKNGEKVGFVGNSITHSGDFHHYVLLYYATRFPNEKVAFYNLGIRGDNAYSFQKRMEVDILPKKADWYIVMAGMNDVNRLLYNADKQWDPEVKKQQQWALNDYKKNYEKVIQRLLETKAKLVLQKPSIYDQTGDLPTPNQMGVNDALEKCCVIIDDLAKKYKLQVIDYFTIMTEINRKIQSVDAKKTIIGNDRVHPNAPGHFVMAYQFLKSLQSPTYVSAIEIKNNKLKKVNNAEVTDFSSNNKSISFKLKEKALPFPMPLEASKALEFVPFIEEFNMQLLKVSPLADGDYALNIDGILAGNFSSVQLEKGVNLAMLKTTPQYKQALLVAQKANSYKNVQRKLRDIKFVEYSYFPKRLWNADLPTLKLFIDSTLHSLKTTNERKFKSLKPQFETYINDKPQQANFEKKADSLPDQIYAENKPGTYHYQIIKVARP